MSFSPVYVATDEMRIHEEQARAIPLNEVEIVLYFETRLPLIEVDSSH